MKWVKKTVFNIDHIRNQFPALVKTDNSSPLVYLDSAATTQKPDVVLNSLINYYRHSNANVHRGGYQLAEKATDLFESARKTLTQFIGAAESDEVIWTSGTTEGLNLIAHCYARSTLKAGDEILIGEMEHHANIVPWQIIAEEIGAKIIKVPMTKACQWDMAAFNTLLSKRTKIVAIAHMTNSTGTRQPIEQVIQAAHSVGAVVVVDGAQAIAHESVDVQALDADFYVFSGHKIFAPTGVGVLYGKRELLEKMPPWLGGGKMVKSVSFEKTTFDAIPYKFEAGTPNISGVIALGAAINWFSQLPLNQIESHIHSLQAETYAALQMIKGVNVIGFQKGSSNITFTIDDIHHQDIATLLAQQSIAVRAGHHCAHPFINALGVKGTIRISFALYNNHEDVVRFIQGLNKAIAML